MAAGMFAPGAIHHFVAFRNAATTYLYLGTAEVAPEVEADPSYLPVMNDLSGRSKPFDEVYDGETHSVFTTLNRFDHMVYRRARDPIGHVSAVADVGIDSRTEHGVLTYGTGDFKLVLVYDLGGTGDLPSGRLYYGAKLGAWKETTSGNRLLAVSLRFDCHRLYTSPGRFDLFTDDLTGLTLTVN